MVFTTSKSWQWPWFRLSIWWIDPCAEDDSPRKIGWFGTKSGCACVWKWDIPMYTQNWHCFAWKHDDEQADFMDFLPKSRNAIWIWWGYNQQSNSSCLQRSPKLSFYACFFMIHHKSADSCNISCTYMNRVKSSCAGIPKWYQSPLWIIQWLFVRPNIAVGCCFFLLGQWLQFPIWHCLNKSCLQLAGQNTSWQQEKPDNWVLKPLCDEKHVLSIPR